MGRVADFFREQNIPLAQQQRAKMVSLDGECGALKAERDTLKAENLKLQADVNPLKREVERLKKQIEQAKAQAVSKATEEHLDETEVKVLTFLASSAMGSSRKPTLHQIARHLNANPIRTEVLLNQLEEKGYVWHALSMGDAPAEYEMYDKGKEYLVKHNIV